MTITIEMLASYLGKDDSVLLADPLFKNWTFEKSFEDDLAKPRIDYEFDQDGMDVICDGNGKVRTILVYSDECRAFKEYVQDLPLTLGRSGVIARLGVPSKSGDKVSDEILGEYGAWDRFTRSDYVIHVGYRSDGDVINKVTLMRADVVP